MQRYNEHMPNILSHSLINKGISKTLKLVQRAFEELCI